MHVACEPDWWRGRVDGEEGEAGVRWHQRVRPLAPWTERGVVLHGFRCDEGVARNHGRPGAAEGPAALRAMLGNLPWHRATPVWDDGDVVCELGALEAAQAELGARVATSIRAGHRPIVLGGGHEVAWGTWQGVAEASSRLVGVINLDAHLDVRAGDRATSGTPFRQIGESLLERGLPFRYLCIGASELANTRALFDRARRLGGTWVLDEEVWADGVAGVLGQVDALLDQVEQVYLTVCLDVLPAAVAPGVSAPAAAGIGLDVVEAVIRRVVGSGMLVAADVAELNPRHDVDGRTARTAARIVARLAG